MNEELHQVQEENQESNETLEWRQSDSISHSENVTR